MNFINLIRKFYDGGFASSLSSMGFSGSPAGLISAGTNIAIGGANIIMAAHLNKSAKNIERNAGPRPDYSTPQSILDNQSIAESEAANGGMSDVASIAYTNKSERDFGNALHAILVGGGSPNNFAEAYDSQTDAAAQMAMINEELRTKKINNLALQNEKMADYVDTEWELNKYKPWSDSMAKAAELRKSATQRIDKGMDLIGSAMNNSATGGLYNNKGTMPGSGGDAGAGNGISVSDIMNAGSGSGKMTPEQELIWTLTHRPQ